jgi:hypothetical protein
MTIKGCFFTILGINLKKECDDCGYYPNSEDCENFRLKGNRLDIETMI